MTTYILSYTKKLLPGLLALLFIAASCTGQAPLNKPSMGAAQTDQYIPFLQNKNVAVVSNHSSLIGETHLVDSLLSLKINVVKVFSPEHGFRGNADAGQKVDDKIDVLTGLPIISLYGKHKKPTSEDLSNVDIVIFDIQDVGTRFYTYISTMTLVMQACAENDVPVIILDRPNPNGFYVDGPVMKPEFQSFVGMHPIPIVHGMTVGEYAQMVNGEYWLMDSVQCDLRVVPVKNYTHSNFYELPQKPSPNLPNKYAVYLYPSLCLFEGTDVSIGRGTDYPFQVIGHPNYLLGSFVFTPHSIPGAATHPKHEGINCYGQSLVTYAQEMKNLPAQLNLSWIIAYHTVLNDSTDFFNNYFEKLAGTDQLRKQIKAGQTEEQIRESWQADLSKFKQTRKQYLLYPDFY